MSNNKSSNFMDAPYKTTKMSRHLVFATKKRCITFKSRKLSNERCNKKAGDLNRGLNKWTESGACQ